MSDAAAHPVPAASDSAAPAFNPVNALFKPLASLKLTVALLGLSVFLVFAGTLAQVDAGIWNVVDQYFRPDLKTLGFAVIELKIFFPRSWEVPGWFPFPGGWLIGAVMLANLLAAHAVRFRIKAEGTRLYAGLGVLGVGAWLTWVVIASAFDEDLSEPLSPTWRILWQLIQGGGAGLVLLASCWMIFGKRAGIVLIHGGIILLMFSELITGLTAVEGQMRLYEGQSSSVAEDIRNVELAVIDPSDPKSDQVTVVPGPLLARAAAKKQPFTHALLPFDIEVQAYFENSDLVGPAMAREWATYPSLELPQGKAWAIPKDTVSGVAAQQSADLPSAYLRLLEKGTGKELGRHLVSLWMSIQEPPRPIRFEINGKVWDLTLRFKQMVLHSRNSPQPFTLHLIDFRHEKYVGTSTPKDFSSFIRLTDPDRGVDREVRIWMNNPLRYADRTFYQSSFDSVKEQYTVLQVVHNSGWMLPYVSLMIVAIGLLTHFGQLLVNFSRKRLAV